MGRERPISDERDVKAFGPFGKWPKDDEPKEKPAHKWEVSKNGVSHFKNSAFPGGNGNIVIYGHNKKNILGSLDFLQKGDEISLITEGDAEFKYKVRSIETVSPEKVEVINPTNFEILTIYTCTGLFDSKRLVVKADPA